MTQTLSQADARCGRGFPNGDIGGKGKNPRKWRGGGGEDCRLVVRLPFVARRVDRRPAARDVQTKRASGRKENNGIA